MRVYVEERTKDKADLAMVSRAWEAGNYTNKIREGEAREMIFGVDPEGGCQPSHHLLPNSTTMRLDAAEDRDNFIGRSMD